MRESKAERRSREAQARDVHYLVNGPVNAPFDDSNSTKGRLGRFLHSLIGTKRERKMKERSLS